MRTRGREISTHISASMLHDTALPARVNGATSMLPRRPNADCVGRGRHFHMLDTRQAHMRSSSLCGRAQ